MSNAERWFNCNNNDDDADVKWIFERKKIRKKHRHININIYKYIYIYITNVAVRHSSVAGSLFGSLGSCVRSIAAIRNSNRVGQSDFPGELRPRGDG